MRRVAFIAVCGAVLLAGCGTPGAPVPPSLQLPAPVRDLHATRIGDSVALTFTLPSELTDGSRVKRLGAATLVACADATCAKQTTVKDIAAGPPGVPLKLQLPVSATDSSPIAHYAVIVNNNHGRNAGVSNVVDVPLVAAWPEPQSVIARVTSDAVIFDVAEAPSHPDVTTKGCAASACYRYQLYRVDANANGARPVRVVSVAPGQPLRDTSFEWEQQYTYSVHVVNTVADAAGKKLSFETGPPLTTSVYTKDVFAPAAPTGLVAVFSGAPTESGAAAQASIDLNWNPNTERDLAGYNVYRAAGSGAAARINTQLLKTPTFRDTNVAAGESYSYTVTAVDARGNESEHSDTAIEKVPSQQ